MPSSLASCALKTGPINKYAIAQRTGKDRQWSYGSVKEKTVSVCSGMLPHTPQWKALSDVPRGSCHGYECWNPMYHPRHQTSKQRGIVFLLPLTGQYKCKLQALKKQQHIKLKQIKKMFTVNANFLMDKLAGGDYF